MCKSDTPIIFVKQKIERNKMTEQDLLKEISFILRGNLLEKRMSQSELARRTGIERSLITRYVNGKCMPSLVNILNICFVLDVDIQDEIGMFGIIK